MSTNPSDLRYTNEHEWIQPGGSHRIGLTQFAVNQLGDVVMVDLNVKVGDTIAKGDSFGNVESVKAVSEIYAPISGTITAINDDLRDKPELVNTDPYGDAWIVEVEPANAGDITELMDSAAYDKFISEQ